MCVLACIITVRFIGILVDVVTLFIGSDESFTNTTNDNYTDYNLNVVCFVSA